MSAPIGHETAIENLAKLAAEGGLPHGYIFYGPSMVGKRATALALAHDLEAGTFDIPSPNRILLDARIIDPGSANSIGIDAVREIKNFFWQRPNSSSRRTCIVDDAELLTAEAQSALLKIAEEPPASSLLVVITSDIESIMPTVLSRLQKIYFGAVREASIAAWLEKEQGLAKTLAAALAKKSFGKPGLAWRMENDKEFGAAIGLAEAFLRTTPATRREFLKKLLDPDEFRLRKFLDAVIITLAWERPVGARAGLWHKTLALYQSARNFNLNPRLQLEALLA